MSILDYLICAPYSERKIAREWATVDILVSTAEVPDGIRPYETAVRYRGGEWRVIAAYHSSNDALAGHECWMATFRAGTRPDAVASIFNMKGLL